MRTVELKRFLEEDVGSGDITGAAVPDVHVKAHIKAGEDGILAGLEEAKQIFEHFGLDVQSKFRDGAEFKKGDVILEVSGNARSILVGERLALNFLGRMSGIATLTRSCVKCSKGVTIAGTRKTTPGFRKFEKKAIKIGGGHPHRFNLAEAVLIKDNHIKIAGLKAVIDKARELHPEKNIEVEVEDTNDAIKAAQLGIDTIMFDNMAPEDIMDAVEKLKKASLRTRVKLEASGGITLDNLNDYADTGVDIISMGALTHSAGWLNFNLNLVE
ncbi:MAG: carboxylating nicotinate-nucleotide diphosphorylase [Methanosarcinales archaeon Met12]|nr:MAG: carboxylating nicotinate-nucleotide diphosphorylase [Methanosarcinales archaeon Met12]